MGETYRLCALVSRFVTVQYGTRTSGWGTLLGLMASVACLSFLTLDYGFGTSVDVGVIAVKSSGFMSLSVCVCLYFCVIFVCNNNISDDDRWIIGGDDLLLGRWVGRGDFGLAMSKRRDFGLVMSKF